MSVEPVGDGRPRTAAVPVLEVHKMSVGYGAIPVVNEINLRVDAGEVVALFGPNGAGKSTTLLAIAGELLPSAGDVTWLGTSAQMPLHARARRGLAFVPEQRGVISSLSVHDNLRIGAGSVDQALEVFPQLRPLLGRRARLLSGGEQQMLGLARALAAEPRLLLADELSLGLAPLVVRRLLEAIRDAADQRHLGALLVEQQVRNALAVADRVYVLNRGQIVLEGTPRDLTVAAVEEAYMSQAPSDDAVLSAP